MIFQSCSSLESSARVCRRLHGGRPPRGGLRPRGGGLTHCPREAVHPVAVGRACKVTVNDSGVENLKFHCMSLFRFPVFCEKSRIRSAQGDVQGPRFNTVHTYVYLVHYFLI